MCISLPEPIPHWCGCSNRRCHNVTAEKLCQSVLSGVQALQEQKGTTMICESETPDTLIVRFTPTSKEGSPSAGSVKSPGFSGQLSLRVNTDYPESTPAYFRQITSDQTVQEQTQVRSTYPCYARPAVVAGISSAVRVLHCGGIASALLTCHEDPLLGCLH